MVPLCSDTIPDHVPSPLQTQPQPQPQNTVHNMANFFLMASENAQKISLLSARVEELEKMVNGSSYRAPSKGPNKKFTSEEKLSLLARKSREMEKERAAIIEFNRVNSSRDCDNMLRWSYTTVLKSGTQRTMTFTKADDNMSLTWLIQSEHKDSLCQSGPEIVNITANIFKKYGVVIVNNELVTLCRDYKGGIGKEYLWSSDEDMANRPPSADWKNASKKANDPRRKFIDPQTMELWIPDDEKVVVEDSAGHSGIVEDAETSSSTEDSAPDEKGEEVCTSDQEGRGVKSGDEAGDKSSDSESVTSDGDEEVGEMVEENHYVPALHTQKKLRVC